MRMDRLTLKAQEAVNSAQELATARDHYEIQPIHLLNALSQQEGGIFSSIASKVGAPEQEIRREGEAALGTLPRQTGAGPGGGALSPSLRDIMNEAWNEAVKLQDQYLSTEHLILALASKKNDRSKEILNSHSITRENLLKVLKDIRGSRQATSENAEEQYDAL